jgi:hypothetical protein
MYHEVLSNFSTLQFKFKVVLWAIISLLYSLLFTGARNPSVFGLRNSTSRSLTIILIRMLIVEQMASLSKQATGKIHAKNFRKSEKFFGFSYRSLKSSLIFIEFLKDA